MKALPLLLALLLLGACGDQTASTNPSPNPGGPVEVAAQVDPAPVLTARDTPLGRGELAPPFEGLPEGKTVVVFYRGPW